MPNRKRQLVFLGIRLKQHEICRTPEGGDVTRSILWTVHIPLEIIALFKVMDNTTICTHCQALAIDSRDHDLQDTTSENGRIVLESPWSIPLKYKRRDTYPDLPALKASADHGCAMCGLLRKHIIDSYSSKFVEILSQITENDGCITLYDFTYMRYDYDELNKGPAGFSHLSGSLDVQYGELSDLVYMSTHWPIQFSIAAAEGKLQYILRRLHQ